VSRYKFDIVHNGTTHQLDSTDINAKIIVEGMEEVIKASPVKRDIDISGL
jgi:hypothetical protein